MKIRKVLSRYLVSCAILLFSLLFVAQPVAALSLGMSDSGWIASSDGQYASGLAECNALSQKSRDISGNITPGPRN